MATTGPSVDTPTFNGQGWATRPASETDLARGMLLLRASNMNVMRLQLAMERSDRRLAMEALDGLVALDGEIRGLIHDMPPPDDSLSEMTRRLDAQRADLASEKLVFAAGRTGPSLARRTDDDPASRPAMDEPTSARSLNLASAGEPEAQPQAEWVPAYLMEEERTAGRGRRFAIAAAVMLLLILLGAAALYVAGLATLPLGALPFTGGES